MKSRKIILVLILFLAAFLRLYKLGSYPPLNADEAALGYNAWSLLETGKDEHGDSWPLHFKSFGDYKPGAYIYLILPVVKIFGLNEWSVRVPAALLGVATVGLAYFLAKLLWKDERLGLLWAGILTLSPWHLHFSRGGWESNVALFLITLGVYLFYCFKLKTKKTLFWAGLSFVLSMYTYHSARLIVPALILGLAYFNREFLFKKRKKVIKSVLLVGILLVPLALSFMRGGASARFSGVGLMADPGPLWRANELRGQYANPNGIIPTLFHNRYFLYAISFSQKYFSHFNGRFLFIEGDSVPRSKLPDMGVMHLVEVVFLLLGAYYWLKSKKKEKYLLGLWLLVAPLASAMTFQAPSALRSLSLTVPFSLLVAVGINNLLKIKLKQKIVLILLLVIAYVWSFVYWQDRYFIHYLKRFPSAWPDFRVAAEQLKREKGKVCVEGDYDQPYIMALFYLQYPAEKIQKEIELTPPDEFGFSTVKQFGNYQFGDCAHFDGKIVK